MSSTRTSYVAFDDEPGNLVLRVSDDPDGMISIDFDLQSKYSAGITVMLGKEHAERLLERLLNVMPPESLDKVMVRTLREASA